jgi:hypothetical protein
VRANVFTLFNGIEISCFFVLFLIGHSGSRLSATRSSAVFKSFAPRQRLIDSRCSTRRTLACYAEALYPVAYKLKFASKALGQDYVVPPLEALWWSADMATFTSARDKSQWDWTLMLMAPDWITEEQFDAARAKAGIEGVRLETLAEGRCAQTLHVGSFDDETETLAHLHDEFIPDAGLTMTGKHHEI